LKIVQNILLGKSELLLEKKHIKILNSFLTPEVRNAQNIYMLNDFLSNVITDLKQSHLSDEKQKYYFEKIRSLTRDDFHDYRLNFTSNEMRELETVKFHSSVSNFSIYYNWFLRRIYDTI